MTGIALKVKHPETSYCYSLKLPLKLRYYWKHRSKVLNLCFSLTSTRVLRERYKLAYSLKREALLFKTGLRKNYVRIIVPNNKQKQMFSLPTAAQTPSAEKNSNGFCARVCATGGVSGCWTLLTTKTSPRAEWGWAGWTAARNTTARTHGDRCFWLYVLILSLWEQRWICWESGAIQELDRNQT